MLKINKNKSNSIRKRVKFSYKQSKGTYPTGNDDACDNRDKSDVSQPSLSFERHQIGKHGSEERRGGANGLVE